MPSNSGILFGNEGTPGVFFSPLAAFLQLYQCDGGVFPRGEGACVSTNVMVVWFLIVNRACVSSNVMVVRFLMVNRACVSGVKLL